MRSQDFAFLSLYQTMPIKIQTEVFYGASYSVHKRENLLDKLHSMKCS